LVTPSLLYATRHAIAVHVPPLANIWRHASRTSDALREQLRSRSGTTTLISGQSAVEVRERENEIRPAVLGVPVELDMRETMMEDVHGNWLCSAVSTVVQSVGTKLGRPLRLQEVHQIVLALGERVRRECEQRATADEAPDEPVACKRKPELSMTRSAIKSRDSRRRVKDRAQRGVEVVQVEVGEQHVDELERRGHYQARLERIDATKAIAAAVEGLLDAVTPKK